MAVRKHVEGNEREHFSIKAIKDDLVAFECEFYPGHYMKANAVTGPNQLTMVESDKATVKGLQDDPWAWFKMVTVGDGVFALESQKFPGHYLETVAAVEGSDYSALRLRSEPNIK